MSGLSGSPAKKSSKRKRVPTAGGGVSARTPRESDVKEEQTGKASPSTAMLPPELPPNALGLDVPPHAAFFKARSELEEGNADVWAALASAVQEYKDAQSDVTLPISLQVPGGGVPGLGLGEDVSDEELFAQFIDFPPIPDTHTQARAQGARNSLAIEAATPELYFSSWGHGEGVEEDSDLSPESIRTVGSTTGITIGPMGVTASTRLSGGGAGQKEGGKYGVAGMGDGADADGDASGDAGQSGTPRLLLQSPASAAYNGGLFAWEDYDFSEPTAA
jgi:hypothetical protein